MLPLQLALSRLPQDDQSLPLRVETSDGNLSKGMRQLNGVYTMHEIADHFGVRYSTVSRAVRWLEEFEPGAA